MWILFGSCSMQIISRASMSESIVDRGLMLLLVLCEQDKPKNIHTPPPHTNAVLCVLHIQQPKEGWPEAIASSTRTRITRSIAGYNGQIWCARSLSSLSDFSIHCNPYECITYTIRVCVSVCATRYAISFIIQPACCDMVYRSLSRDRVHTNKRRAHPKQ